MDTNRKTAITVGVLFIIGTISGILSAVYTAPVLDSPDYLNQLSANQSQLILGAFFVLLMGFSLAMIPVVLYPLFKKYNQVLALGAVVFRGALEAAAYIGIVVIWLMLIALGQEYFNAGMSDTANFQTLGAVLLQAGVAITQNLALEYSPGALTISNHFTKSRLIPGWLSWWGFIGGILYLTAGLTDLFGIDLGVLIFPLALQEMVMAVWLIVKGFNNE